jgi:protein ImuB
MLDTKAFFKLLDLDLGAHPPPAPVVKVWLEAEPAKPRAAQTGLFIPIAPEPEKLELTLARLKALVGEGSVGSPELLDTHRPGAFAMRRYGGAETDTAGDTAGAGGASADGFRAAGACSCGWRARARSWLCGAVANIRRLVDSRSLGAR